MGTFIYTPCSRVIEGQNKKFNHHFGGNRYSGTLPAGCSVPLNQLYVFDTRDPLVPVKISKVSYPPLFYSFAYNAGAVGYQVLSDSKIKILYMENSEAKVDFPYTNYPESFPETEVVLEELSYEDQKIIAFNHFVEQPESGLKLSRADSKRLEQLHYPFTQLGGVHVMWQDIPTVRCPNLKCSHHKNWHGMDVFAVLWNEPVRGVYLGDKEDPDGCDVQIIFQICPKCQSIHVCNSIS
jgi:hypothetical protein